jgi:hemerythrin superfamily protein
MIQRMIRRIPLIGKLLLGRKLNATDLLRKQHMKIEALLALCKITRNKERRRMVFRQIKSDLEMHTELEEKIFYPACAQHETLAPLVRDSYKEHQQMKDLLEEMTGIPADDKLFGRRLNRLFLIINAHVNKEENKLFPRAKRLLGAGRLKRLADEMRAYQQAQISTSAP